ncbi:MAG: hypothetical protein CO117_10375 [Flavobacteriaceae bacterium CG_4_9_14_3_um_filter_33_16]|nr:MAG: hypothetical protein CO117_10375 [Flavobacteriaceae bacterium CG_4_9_14_3_um_filter_33_16]
MMGKIISEKEWLKWDKSFFWIKHSSLLPEGMKDNTAIKDIMLKWADKNLNGWTTFIDGYWMFEFKSDAAILKSLIICGYFQNDMGEL